MPSSISSSDPTGIAAVEPGQGPNAHQGPLAPGLRLTASDRPGMAQPVSERDVPPLPWMKMILIVFALVFLITLAWEWHIRTLGFEPGDLGDEPSAWAEQRRRLDTGPVPVAIIGDSRILFDTDLDRFKQLTGVRPVQLALAGTNARPVLEDVAASRFNGLLIVGITELSYYREGLGLGGKALARGQWESPGQRVSFLIFRALRRGLAMLDNDTSLSTSVLRRDEGWRKGAHGPYDDVWKLEVTGDDRQTGLWPAIEQNAYLRAHAIRMWMIIYGFPGPKPDVIAMTEARTRAAVVKIRARGGDVIFVRPPSASKLRAMEEARLPRDKGWEALLKTAQVKGVHFDDLPNAQGLWLPELSHLHRSCALVFTDAYVRALTKITPRLHLLARPLRTLEPRDCLGAS
ncbi:hypothetical protein BH10PSE12_BH10PSE12_12560 [soil metagenome]